MATTTFTTWTALYQDMLNKLASGSFTVTEATLNGKTIKYGTAKDIRDQLDYVRTMAAFEAGTAAPRTYAGQGGSGGM
jgi:hypothetical protein